MFWRVLAVALVLLLAGCAKPAASPTSTPTETDRPKSTRESRVGGAADPQTGRPVAEISQRDSDYTFRRIGEFTLKFQKTPLEAGPEPHRLLLNGTDNRSFFRITTTFFVNPAFPVHSGTSLICLRGTTGFSTCGPTMLAVWADGTRIVQYQAPFIFFPTPSTSGGYWQTGPPYKAIRGLPEYPTEALFATSGWGDIQVRIVLDEARLNGNATRYG